jgi:hypothetical protein
MDKLLNNFNETVNTPALKLMLLLRKFLDNDNIDAEDKNKINEILPCLIYFPLIKLIFYKKLFPQTLFMM